MKLKSRPHSYHSAHITNKFPTRTYISITIRFSHVSLVQLPGTVSRRGELASHFVTNETMMPLAMDVKGKHEGRQGREVGATGEKLSSQ
jgi:hypothetical protein